MQKVRRAIERDRLTDADWVVLEKVHGSNFSFSINGKAMSIILAARSFLRTNLLFGAVAAAAAAVAVAAAVAAAAAAAAAVAAATAAPFRHSVVVTALGSQRCGHSVVVTALWPQR